MLSVSSYKKSIFLVSLCSSFFSFSVQASDSAVLKVEQATIFPSQVLNVTITVPKKIDGTPNFSALEKDFMIVDARKSVDNKANNQNSTEWQIQLKPKHAGDIFIPSLKIAGTETDPVLVTVKVPNEEKQKLSEDSFKIQQTDFPANNTIFSDNRDVFMLSEISSTDPYVKSQLNYTVKIFYSVSIQEATISEPQVANAIIRRLDGDKNYQINRDGRLYQVYERDYAIFPQQSGRLEIISPIFMGQSIETDTPASISSYVAKDLAPTKPFRIKGKDLVVDVKSAPASYDSKNWLPVQHLSLSEKWSDDLTSLAKGQPITRTITLTAYGVPAEELPTLLTEQKLPHLNVIVEKPQLRTDVDNGVIVSQRIEKAIYTADDKGTYSIPAVELTWWDTLRDAPNSTLLPQQLLVVRADKLIDESSVTAMDTPIKPLPPQKPFNEVPKSSFFAKINWSVFIAAAVAAFGLIVAFRLASRFLKNRAHKQQLVIKPIQKVPARKTSTVTANANHFTSITVTSGPSSNKNNFEQTVSFKEIRQELKDACRRQDPTKAKEMLIRWANLRWQDKRICSLGELISQVDTFEFKTWLHELNRILYAKYPKAWDGVAFWHAFVIFSQENSVKQQQELFSSDDENDLPPLSVFK